MNYFFVGNRKHQSKNKQKIKWITFLVFGWRQVASRTPEELWSAEGNAKFRSRLSRPSSVKVWTFTFLFCLTKARKEKWFELLHFCFVWQKRNRMARKDKLVSNLALYLHKNQWHLKKFEFLIDNLLIIYYLSPWLTYSFLLHFLQNRLFPFWLKF